MKITEQEQSINELNERHAFSRPLSDRTEKRCHGIHKQPQCSGAHTAHIEVALSMVSKITGIQHHITRIESALCYPQEMKH